MSREVARALGGWRLSDVTGEVYRKPGSEEVAPDSRVALNWADDRLEAGRFIKVSEETVALVGGNVAGLATSPVRRQ